MALPLVSPSPSPHPLLLCLPKPLPPPPPPFLIPPSPSPSPSPYPSSTSHLPPSPSGLVSHHHRQASVDVLAMAVFLCCRAVPCVGAVLVLIALLHVALLFESSSDISSDSKGNVHDGGHDSEFAEEAGGRNGGRNGGERSAGKEDGGKEERSSRSPYLLYRRQDGTVYAHRTDYRSRPALSPPPLPLSLPLSLPSARQQHTSSHQNLRAVTVPAPSEPQVRHISIRSVLISWSYQFDVVPPPVSFVVQVMKDAQPFQNASELLEGNSTQFVYSGLLTLAFYQFRVLAYALGSWSEPSEPSAGFLNGDTAPSGPPTNVRAEAESYSSIQLSWDKPIPEQTIVYLFLVYWGTDPTNLEKNEPEPFSNAFSHSFTQLLPNTTYYFGIVTDVSGHLSVISAIVSATTDPPYLPSVDIVNASSSSTWISLEWSQPDPNRYPLVIDSFVVFSLEIKGGQASKPFGGALADQPGVQAKKFGPQNRAANITGLEPGTPYAFQVVYYASGYTSDLSDIFTAWTVLELLDCFYCQPLSPSALEVKWRENSEKNISFYEVLEETTDKGGGEYYTLLGEVFSREGTDRPYSYVIEGLPPWTDHLVVVRAFANVSVEGSRGGGRKQVEESQCPRAQCKTTEAAPSAAPIGFEASLVSANSITLAWSPPPVSKQNGHITSYALSWRCIPGWSWQPCSTKQANVSSASQNMSYTLNGLHPYTRYSLEVAAASKAGVGPFSSPINATTLEDAPSTPPKDIVAEKVTDTSVEMSWKAPDPSTTNGVISSYRVLFKKWEMVNFRRIGPLEIPRGESDDSVTAPMLSGRITTNDTGVVLRNLSPSTLYSITVSAATGAGRGPESAPVLVTTLEPQALKLDLNLTYSIAPASDPDCSYTMNISWTMSDNICAFGNLTDTPRVTNYTLHHSCMRRGITDTTNNNSLPFQTNATHFEISVDDICTDCTKCSMFVSFTQLLANALLLQAKSNTIEVVIPACSREVATWIVGTSVSGSLLFLTLVCSLVAALVACSARKRRQSLLLRQQSGMFMDDHPLPVLTSSHHEHSSDTTNDSDDDDDSDPRYTETTGSREIDGQSFSSVEEEDSNLSLSLLLQPGQEDSCQSATGSPAELDLLQLFNPKPPEEDQQKRRMNELGGRVSPEGCSEASSVGSEVSSVGSEVSSVGSDTCLLQDP